MYAVVAECLIVIQISNVLPGHCNHILTLLGINIVLTHLEVILSCIKKKECHGLAKIAWELKKQTKQNMMI